MNTQKTRKSCEDYVEVSRISFNSLTKAKEKVTELRIMRPELIHVIQSGKKWDVASYAYQPVNTNN